MVALPRMNIEHLPYPAMPPDARLSLNRCNLPGQVLGSVWFQHHPQPLWLDGVHELHRQLFTSLASVDDADMRALHFMDYMRSSFLLDNLDQAGLNPAGNFPRPRADYLRVLRGWMFDSDSQEAAVLKGWVESRFGLLTRHHLTAMGDYHSHSYMLFQASRARGLYNTNALEAQLDLLYAFCQHELMRRFPDKHHLPLYRGTNGWNRHDVLQARPHHHYVLLLNNLNSFTSSRTCAHTFGDHLIKTQVPLAKIFYFPQLLPGTTQSEEEFLVIGGLYEVQRLKW